MAIKTTELRPQIDEIAYVRDIKANGVIGGGYTAGSYALRDLNDLSGDTDFISLNANQFILQPGTYEIEAESAGYKIGNHKIKLRNITDSTDDITGLNNRSTGDDHVGASLTGVIVITSVKTFEIQHRGSTTNAVDGFGNATSFGDSEIYTQVKITKVYKGL